MAVPKKKMSKSRRNSRKTYWKKKALKKAVLAISLAKSLFNKDQNNFVV